ncbi:receptor-like serine/threonine-protein kinase ALE2-like protein [Trifolium pratense]|uniref:Receptor-like serine/threonine-protein kinase ALE2-like protein n=1 Tax=Trifolium pratense TaxID=57577 RepID=A0A2K3NXF9_TRIPR|nr:receptor-like serine/threonine-protein kinase ALE2-like protein [Trifolium pratense]PNY07714.1 receptor-like serine/threonine-protein kinase ALE2-like protein [Trifolium pratense]PNY08540.1 receptor-like serine/threonine-protein kinase ALE2-like protein [Trifolium pratense]
MRCLVYELVRSGSVESHLHGADQRNNPLDWEARKKKLTLELRED